MTRNGRWAFALVFCAVTARAQEAVVSTAPAEAPLYLVSAPVADLRAEPKLTDGAAALKSPYSQDPLQESQLIYGERVKGLVEKGPWVRVEAVEQEEYTHADAWTGYPGWVLKSALTPEPAGHAPNAVICAAYARMTPGPSRNSQGISLPAGARVAMTFEKDAWARIAKIGGGDGWVLRKDLRLFSELPSTDSARRASILDTARLFLREPYFWGGRAGHREGDVSTPSGMDCSGLVNIAYRVAGVDVPRDSHEQYRRSRGLSGPQELKPGDLVFLAWTRDPEKVTHVMIYAGGDDVVEAVQEHNTVRQVAIKEKLGRPLRDIAVMEPVGDRLVYFGRLLPE